MKIEIKRIANGLLVTFELNATASDPLAQRSGISPIGALPWVTPAKTKAPLSGTFFAHDGTDLLGYIAERIEAEYGFQSKGD